MNFYKHASEFITRTIHILTHYIVSIKNHNENYRNVSYVAWIEQF